MYQTNYTLPENQGDGYFTSNDLHQLSIDKVDFGKFLNYFSVSSNVLWYSPRGYLSALRVGSGIKNTRRTPVSGPCGHHTLLPLCRQALWCHGTGPSLPLIYTSICLVSVHLHCYVQLLPIKTII